VKKIAFKSLYIAVPIQKIDSYIFAAL